ncbi:MAG: cyclic nucleotide-binding protein [Hyphomicrobiales bacterium]|nr:cyclic nucleotide-binding protein [Hyphomicrobiales bacterium]
MSHVPMNNRLLLRLPPEDLAALMPLLEEVSLNLKQVVIEPAVVIQYVYFPESCVCSILARTDHVNPIEVGMVGFEGMTDMVLREGDRTPLRAIIQLPGTAWRMKAVDFAQAIQTYRSLNYTVMRFKEALAIQFAYTALAHGSFTIEERLARWLLMSHDRARKDTMPLVHEFMAAMLAVRRSGVTTAIHILEGSGAIRAARGIITIRDREKLEEFASGSYGVPEAEYERLMAG